MVAVGSSCSISCLEVRLSACSFLVSVDIAGRLGGSLDRVGCGQAELGRPALDVRPKSMALMEVLFAGHAGQGRSGDGGVAVKVWPGSQDTSQPGWAPGACRAVWVVWSLVMVVSLIVSVMMVTSGSVRDSASGLATGRCAEELLQVVTGNEPTSADFSVGQVAAAHFVVEQVAGQAGQAGASSMD
jgi:hypothetical protein